MPYANIHWIKLKLEILNDKRFIFDCNNDQKWLYIGLLLLAGNTRNSISNDENYIKNRLNLPETSQKIRENLDHLLKIFPKMLSKDGIIKFKNFNDLHNKLGNYFGTPLELQENSKGNKEKIRIEKIRIEKIIYTYIDKKGFNPTKNEAIRNLLYKRNCRTARNLAILSKGEYEKITEAMNWFGDICDKKGYSWTLETIEKWFPEYLVKGKAVEYDKLLEKYNLKKR